MSAVAVYRVNPDGSGFDIYGYSPSVYAMSEPSLNAARAAYREAYSAHSGKMAPKPSHEYLEREVVDGLFLRYRTNTHRQDVDFAMNVLRQHAESILKTYEDFPGGTGDVIVVFMSRTARLERFFEQMDERECLLLAGSVKYDEPDGTVRYGLRSDLFIGPKTEAHDEDEAVLLKSVGLSGRSTLLELWAKVTTVHGEDSGEPGAETLTMGKRQLAFA